MSSVAIGEIAQKDALIERMLATLINLEFAFAETSDITETPFTLHALAAIRQTIAEAKANRGSTPRR